MKPDWYSLLLHLNSNQVQSSKVPGSGLNRSDCFQITVICVENL